MLNNCYIAAREIIISRAAIYNMVVLLQINKITFAKS